MLKKRRLTRTIISVAAAAALSAGILPSAVMAEEIEQPLEAIDLQDSLTYPTGGLRNGELIPLDEVPEDAEAYLASTETEYQAMMTVSDAIRDALLSGTSQVFLSAYNTTDYAMLANVPDFCPYVDGEKVTLSGCYYNPNTGQYAYLYIYNTMSSEETSAYVDQVDAAIDSYLSLADRSSMSDLDIALRLHDEIAVRCTYINNGTTTYYSNCALMNGYGVCQAYAYLYMYLLNSLGIDATFISGATKDVSNYDQGWNLVKIYGEFYHVDVTWDDPTNDKFGQVQHNYFLVSDAHMGDARSSSGSAHLAWQEKESCSSTLYDEAYWYERKINSPVIFDGATEYFIDPNGLESYDLSTGTITTIDQIDKWYLWGSTSSYWTGKYSGLFAYDGILYFNTRSSVMMYDPSTGALSAFETVDTTSGYICGIRRSGLNIEYVLLTKPSDAYGTTIYTLDTQLSEMVVPTPEPVEPTPEPVIPTYEDVKIYGRDLTIDTSSRVGLNYYVWVPASLSADSVYADVFLDDASLTTYALSQLEGTSVTDESGNAYLQYKLPYFVNAARMNDSVSLNVYLVEDGIRTDLQSCSGSIVDYANAYLAEKAAEGADASTETDYTSIVQGLLNYGSACQTFFGYETETPANACLSDADRQIEALNTEEIDQLTASYAISGFGEDSPLEMAGCSLLFTNGLVLRTYFYSREIDCASLTCSINYGDSIQTVGTKGLLCYADIDLYEMNADPSALQNLAIYNGETCLGSMDIAAWSYVAKVLSSDTSSEELRQLATAMYRFHQTRIL